MQRKFMQLSLLTAALTLTACSSDSLQVTSQDVVAAANQDDNSIQFGTYMGSQGVTRTYTSGPIANKTNATAELTALSEVGFGVFSYLTTNDSNYDPSNVTTSPSKINPDFMYNQEITWNTSSPAAWVYDPVKYWPNGVDKAGSGTATEKQIQKLSFFAYAPYKASSAFTTIYNQEVDGNKPEAIGSGTTNDSKVKLDNSASATNGIKAITTNDWTGNVWVKYLLPDAQEDKAVDLLWGVRGKGTYNETDEADNTVDTWNVGDKYNINLTKQEVPEKVAFLFKHALTKIGGQTYEDEDNNAAANGDKIGFKIVADVDIITPETGGDHDDQAAYFGTSSNFDNTKTLITLRAIKIQDGKTATDDSETSVTGITNSGIFNSGWFNIETGQWAEVTTGSTGSTISIVAKSDDSHQTSKDDKDYSINPNIREANDYSKSTGTGAKKLATGEATWDDNAPTGVSTTAVPVFAKETIPGITLIPGATAQDIYITVDYCVRTADPNLEKGFSEVEQIISNKVSLASLNPNKFYTIIIHLGLTSVKFEAVVADWATNAGGTYNDEGVYNDGGSTANEKIVWLPSNVVTAP